MNTAPYNTPPQRFAVRKFATFAEIEELNGFVRQSPVDQSTYESIIGHYDFPKESAIECCYRKDNGNLCNTNHQFGFVCLLKNGDVSVIGNFCAKEKFDADTSLRKDRRHYQKEQNRLKRKAAFGKLMENKERDLANLGAGFRSLVELRRRVSKLSANLGPMTLGRLQDMAKNRTSRVSIQGVRYRHYTDEEGRHKNHRETAPYFLGSIPGLRIFLRSSFTLLSRQINEIERAYEKAEDTEPDAPASAYNSINKLIGNTDSVVRMIHLMIKEESDFLSGDLSLLCFLASKPSDRYRTARAVLEFKGEDHGKDKAKRYIAELDRKTAQKLEIDKVELY